MNITEDLSIIELVMNASLVVKLVMLLLTAVSLMSWYWIFRKWFAIRDARARTDQVEREFWKGGNLAALSKRVREEPATAGPLGRIFDAGYEEYQNLRSNQRTLDASTVIDGVRRAMRATYQREIDDLEAHLAFLASVGSVSPYVGLFGTVWGIMHAFRGLTRMSSATLAAVAPGIAEALVATAIGLFAAIPAVVAYNRYAHDVDRLSVRFESFMEEFSNIIQRQFK